MATHSSVLAWRIPGTGEPSGLLSMGSHRVGHNWSDLAAAAAAAACYLRMRPVNSTSLPLLFLAKSGCNCWRIEIRAPFERYSFKIMLSHHINRIQTYYLLTDYNDCIKLETFNLIQTVATNYGNVNIMTDTITETIVHCLPSCSPTGCSLPGFSVHGILQARTLEWVAISFSNAWKWKVKVKSLSRVWLLATSWTAAHQAPPSMGFSRQQY